MKIMIKFLLLVSLWSVGIFAQINNLRTHAPMKLDCKKCHLCDTPTKAEPCLVMCPRNKIEPVRHSVEEAPVDIVINEVDSEKDLYTPVNFSHKLHAKMSLMSGGCAICHHYNPPGKIVKCSTCHEKNRERENLSIPDLKAAYHRQCMACHTSWEEKSECRSCHELNDNIKISNTILPKLEKSHAKIKIPDKIVYQTDSDKGELVTYFHRDHTKLFDLKCMDCHKQENCENCHNQKPDFSKPQPDDLHDKCSDCHDTEGKCYVCHSNVEKKPFNHPTKTGFNLSNFHSNISCITCHKTKNRFTGLKKECKNCHKDNEGYFNHSITGIMLDETHKDLDCEDCHVKNNYMKRPTCSDCHEEDISFPKNIPGEKVRKNHD